MSCSDILGHERPKSARRIINRKQTPCYTASPVQFHTPLVLEMAQSLGSQITDSSTCYYTPVMGHSTQYSIASFGNQLDITAHTGDSFSQPRPAHSSFRMSLCSRGDWHTLVAPTPFLSPRYTRSGRGGRANDESVGTRVVQGRRLLRCRCVGDASWATKRDTF